MRAPSPARAIATLLSFIANLAGGLIVQGSRLRSRLEYNPAFDGLRALAAALVIADHCHVPGFDPGYFGVDLFFVLSGFLITRLLLDEVEATGAIGLRAFYLRRFLRLAPPLLLLLVVYVSFAPIAWPQFSVAEHWREAALAAFYLSDYARAFWDTPLVLMHSWSLSVEEHFYLVWPFVVLLIARLQPRQRVTTLFILFLVATAWRVFEYHHAGWAATYFRFDTRLSGLIFGALLAAYLPQIGRITDRSANCIGMLACVGLVICLSMGHWRGPWSLVWMTTLAEFAAAGFLIASSASNSWIRSVLSASPLVGIGVISYGVYLWHYPVAVYFRDWLPWYLTVSITAATAVSVASASYLMIERPLQRYRRAAYAPESITADPQRRTVRRTAEKLARAAS